MDRDNHYGNYRLDYNENREVIRNRQKQPQPSRTGNYRIDSQGNPIIPNPPEVTYREELEQDYFSRQELSSNQVRNQQTSQNIHNRSTVENTRPNQQKQVYQFEDYYRRENDLNHRMRQPNRREYVTAQRSYNQTNQRNVRKPSNNQPQRVRTNENQQQRPNRSWYYKLHQQMDNRSKQASNAKLPKGRTALFAVFSIIYLTMIVTGWQLMPFNKVNNLVVSGNELVPSSFIRDSSRILTYDDVSNVMKQRQEIETIIKDENPLIESVVFNRPNWRQLEISVAEHDIVGIINNNGFHPVLSNGTIIDSSSNQGLASLANESLPELIGFNTSGEINSVAQGLRQVEPEILAMMETITNNDDPNKPNAIIVQMKDGNVIRAISSTFAQKVQYYPDILSQLEGAQGTINFEVGAYFTPDVANANSIKLDNN